LRDLSEDAARGRLYLPRELLEKYGVTSRDPAAVLRNAALPGICRELAKVAAQHYANADTFMRKCSTSAMRPARIMGIYYRAIFNQLVAQDWRDLSARVSLPKWQKIVLLLKGFFV
jgi:phytoene synthase